MSENISKTQQLKDFFKMHKFWLKKYSKILFISILLGAICGLVMVLFNALLILSGILFSFIPYYLSPMIAGGLTSLIVKVGKFNLVLGTGAAEFVEDINLFERKGRYVRLKNIIAKTFATSWTYGSGMLCGLEGPGLLIGGNLGYLIYKTNKFQLEKEESFFIGASACTGAILKAPISGALFCAELPYNNYLKYQSLIPSILASSVAYLFYALFFGFDPLIELHQSLDPTDLNYFIMLPYIIIFGILTGLFVFIFMGLLRGFKNKSERLFNRLKLNICILPFIGGLGYSLFLFLVIPFTDIQFYNVLIQPNSDYLTEFTNLVDSIGVSWFILLLFTFLFAITIFLSIGTSNSAGIILPLMFFGTLIGGFYGTLVSPNHHELFVVLGICAVLGAATNNPITAIFIIIEMTWVPFLFIPAGITTIIAYIFSGPSSIIPQQKYLQPNEI